jgi:hypothetical protein
MVQGRNKTCRVTPTASGESEGQRIQEYSGDKTNNAPEKHCDAANLILWEIIRSQEDGTIIYNWREFV